jgi:hypothetical protein
LGRKPAAGVFIVGDDWRVAAGLAVAFALTWFLEHEGVPAWWLLPPAVALLLAGSARREVRGSRAAGDARSSRGSPET